MYDRGTIRRFRFRPCPSTHTFSSIIKKFARTREVYYEIWISTDPPLGAPQPKLTVVPNAHTMLTINLTRTPATLIHNELRRHSRYRSSKQVRGIPITTNLYTTATKKAIPFSAVTFHTQIQLRLQGNCTKEKFNRKFSPRSC